MPTDTFGDHCARPNHSIVPNRYALEDGHARTDPDVVSDPNGLSNTVAPFGSRDNHIQRCACTQIQRVGSFARSRITALSKFQSEPARFSAPLRAQDAQSSKNVHRVAIGNIASPRRPALKNAVVGPPQ